MRVTDTLPAGLTFGSATPTQGNCSLSGSTVTCDLGILPVLAQATITIAVTPTTVGTITNQASVTGNEPDGHTANNTASETTKVSASPSISGRVLDTNGDGVSGVTMTLSGALSATTQTDSSGFYQFAELMAGGTYVLTPTKSNLSFDPSSQTFNALGADQTANFVASTCTYTLAPTSQSFSAAGGSGSVSVTSLHDCPWTAVSSANWITITSGASGIGSGTVSFNVTLYMGAADFNGDGILDIAASTITPAPDSTPSNPHYINAASILIGDGNGHFTTKSSFDTGSGSTPSIAVSDFNNDGKPDIAFTKGESKVTIVLGDGVGGLRASIPVDTGTNEIGGRDIGVAAADFNGDGKTDIAVADYSLGAQALRNNCAAAPSISGRITESRNTRGLAGVTVTLSGAQAATTQTDDSGNFSFGNLTAGASYVVTPTKNNFRFDPANASVNNLSGIQTANFVGTPILLQFTSADYVVNEEAGSIQISVRRRRLIRGHDC